MIEDEDLLPVVTREQFNAIECNRCGDCCEAFYLPGPLELAQMLGAWDYWGFIQPKLAGFTREQLLEVGWTEEQITGVLDTPARLNDRRMALWLMDIEPTGVELHNSYGHRYQYRCHRFVRTSPSEGYCSVWEDRPETCRSFPNGNPAGPEFPRCSWRVRIEE